MILFIIIFLVCLFSSFKISKDTERVVVFRLGAYSRIAGPGIFFIIPILEVILKVDLAKNVPYYTSMNEEEIKKKVKEVAVDNQLF